MRALRDPVDVALVFRVDLRVCKQFGKPDDGGERIVQLVGDAGDKLADGGEFFALDQLRLRGLDRRDRLFQIRARGLQVLGHAVERLGHLAALVVGKPLDAPGEIAAADRLGVVAQFEQRLGDPTNEAPDHQAAHQHAKHADREQRHLGGLQLVQPVLQGNEQRVAKTLLRIRMVGIVGQGQIVLALQLQRHNPLLDGQGGGGGAFEEWIGQIGLAQGGGREGISGHDQDLGAGERFQFLQRRLSEAAGNGQRARDHDVVRTHDWNRYDQVDVPIQLQGAVGRIALQGETREVPGGRRPDAGSGIGIRAMLSQALDFTGGIPADGNGRGIGIGGQDQGFIVRSVILQTVLQDPANGFRGLRIVPRTEQGSKRMVARFVDRTAKTRDEIPRPDFERLAENRFGGGQGLARLLLHLPADVAVDDPEGERGDQRPARRAPAPAP